MPRHLDTVYIRFVDSRVRAKRRDDFSSRYVLCFLSERVTDKVDEPETAFVVLAHEIASENTHRHACVHYGLSCWMWLCIAVIPLEALVDVARIEPAEEFVGFVILADLT